MKKLKITNIKKNKIKNINLKTERVKSVAYIVACSLFVGVFSLGIYVFGGSYALSYVQALNPFSNLYSSSEGVIFTNSEYKFSDSKNLKFIVPVMSTNVTNENGELNFFVDNSIMVKSCEDGIVTGIGTLPDGKKYIEITHAGGVVTRYSNMDIVGVKLKELVKKGKDIATAKQNSVVTLSVFVDGVSQNLSINKNQVVWES